MTRTRLGDGETEFPTRLNLKVLFEAFEVPWDEQRSRVVFERVIDKLDERERRRKQAMAAIKTLGMAAATAATAGTFRLIAH